MTDERQTERHNERDSQLSAMFDGELPGAECELLARRLARDEALRAQWSRYALVGAALRAERGVKLHDRVATRVQAAIASEPVYGEAESTQSQETLSQETQSREFQNQRSAAVAGASRSRWNRFAAPLGGMGIAAGVAALSIFALRNQEDTTLVADVAPAVQIAPVSVAEPAPAAAAPIVVASVPSSGEPERYVTPSPSSSSSIAPPARLANYVVAHSEYSSPLSRRLALLGLVSNEIQPAEVANQEPEAIAPATAPAPQRARAAGAGDAQ
jgi:sigma-E factor negative regulatory protein RseA